MSLKTLLTIATEDGFEQLDKMEVGSDEYLKTSDILNKFSDRIIEIEKLDAEDINRRRIREADIELREADMELREKQLKQEQLDRYIKHGLTAVSVLGGIILTVWGAKASWRFEETGTVTSTAGRKFINSLFFKK